MLNAYEAWKQICPSTRFDSTISLLFLLCACCIRMTDYFCCYFFTFICEPILIFKVSLIRVHILYHDIFRSLQWWLCFFRDLFYFNLFYSSFLHYIIRCISFLLLSNSNNRNGGGGGYQKRNPNEELFCRDNFLSLNALQMIEQVSIICLLCVCVCSLCLCVCVYEYMCVCVWVVLYILKYKFFARNHINAIYPIVQIFCLLDNFLSIYPSIT